MNTGGQCHPEDSCPTFRLDGFAAFHVSGSQVAAHADGSGGFPHIGKLRVGAESMLAGPSTPTSQNLIALGQRQEWKNWEGASPGCQK